MNIYRWVCRNCNNSVFETSRPYYCDCCKQQNNFRKSYSVEWDIERKTWMQSRNARNDVIEK